MPILRKVVQRRCEQRDCEQFGMPVDTGDACPACKNPLMVRTKWDVRLALVAGVVVLVLAMAVVLLLRLHSSPPRIVVTTLPGPSPETPLISTPAPGVIQEAAFAVSQGEKLASRGLYEEARREFLRATVADPESPMAWANLGAAAAVTRRIEEARHAYEKSLVLAPDNWLSHYNLAVLLAREGDHDGAVRHLERFAALIGPGDEKRQKAVDDLRRDPALRGLLDDPRVRDLAAQAGGKS